jgi:glycosyltransferase involved in cell wall biosynthesis
VNGTGSGPLKVALVHAYPLAEVRRGGERYVDDLARFLAANGHDVDLISGTKGPSGVFEKDGWTEWRFNHQRDGGLRFLGDSERLAVSAFPHLVRHRYDVVHAFMPQVAIAASLAAQPVLFTCLGHPSSASLRLQGRAAREQLVGAAWLATRFAALSISAAEEMRWVRRPAAVLSPGVRLTEFPPKVGGRRPPGPWRLLFASDASATNKGVDLVLAAVVGLRADGHDVELQLGGPGDHQWALDTLGAGRDAAIEATSVLGVGTLDELPGRYRSADVTVLASRGEAFGLVLVESLASGTPVVCSSSGGMAEIVDDPAVGRVFRSDDQADLRRAILETIELARDPATAARCAAHARRWGWDEAVGAAHVDFYRRTVRGQSGRGR